MIPNDDSPNTVDFLRNGSLLFSIMFRHPFHKKYILFRYIFIILFSRGYIMQFTTLLRRYANTTIYYVRTSLRKYYNNLRGSLRIYPLDAQRVIPRTPTAKLFREAISRSYFAKLFREAISRSLWLRCCFA
jgi:hypothetical protein